MTKRTLSNFSWLSACLALALFTSPLLAKPVPGFADSDEEAAREVYTPRGGVVRTVGPSAACDFSNLQSAISASSNDDVLRVMTGTYNGGFLIWSKSLSVIGGFPNCTSTTPTGRSTLNGQGSGLVLDIWYPAAVGATTRLVEIENMIIRNGGGSGFASSGGVLVQARPGRLEVNFRNVEISNNNRTGVSDHGAGLRIVSSGDVDGFGTFVTLDNDSVIAANTTAGDGGGVHCKSEFDDGLITMLRMGTTTVANNEAENGGGLAVDGCQNVFLYNGGPIVLIFPTGGFVLNTANRFGGGIYVENGGEVILRARAVGGFGDADEAALLAGNNAASGGAAMVRDEGSSLLVEDAYVVNNSADASGGAFYVALGGSLTVGRRAGTGACQPIESGGGVLSRPPCSVIEDNSAFGGGAFALVGDSSIDVARTIIRNNTTGGAGGSVAQVVNSSLYTGPDSEFRMEGSVVHDNGGGFLFSAANNARIQISHSTVADNPVTFARVVAFEPTQAATIDVFSSIIQTSSWLSSGGDGTLGFLLDCVIGNAPSADTGATLSFYSNVDPQFVDAAENNYRLQARSPAIDYCDDFSAPLFDDLDGNQRGVAWTGPTPDLAPNPASGDFDLGAFEIPFEVQNVDLAVDSTAPTAFVGSGDSLTLELELTNQGSNTAFADISVIDDFTTGSVVNQQWTCSAPSGVTCSPASGSGDITTTVSDLEPGQSVTFNITANPSNPSIDQEFEYIMIATESGFNFDTNLSNNEKVIQIRTGVFADSFESTP